MKTLEFVEAEIAALTKQPFIGNESDKSKARKRVKFLQPLRLYLETEPKQEMVEEQLRKTLLELTLLDAEWSRDYPTITDEKFRKDWLKQKRIPGMNAQVKRLRYLLES